MNLKTAQTAIVKAIAAGPAKPVNLDLNGLAFTVEVLEGRGGDLKVKTRSPSVELASDIYASGQTAAESAALILADLSGDDVAAGAAAEALAPVRRNVERLRRTASQRTTR